MQRYGSKGSITSITSSSRAGEKKNLPTHMIMQCENDNQIVLLPVKHLVNSSATRIKLNNTATFKRDLNNRKQERGRIIQLGNEEECMEQLQVFEMTAEIAEENSIIDENDEIDDGEKEKYDKQVKNKTTSKKQLNTSFHVYEPMNNESNSNRSISSMKQTTNVVKPKEITKSKYLQIEKEVDKSSGSEDDSLFITSSKGSFYDDRSSTTSVYTSKTITSKKQTTNSVAKELHSEHEDEPQGVSKSQIIIGSQSRNIKKNLVSDVTMLKNSNAEEEEQQQNITDNDMIHKYNDLSKKYNTLSKENTILQSEYDRLVQEHEILKKTTMPIPDAAGRQWFINIGKYFACKGPDTNIVAHAKALNIHDPRDLIACIQDTTSNTARQVVRLLYSSDELLSKKGPGIPTAQRLAIRNFAESQKGPISNHQFNEAINGVFRSKKNEYKKQQENTSLESTSNESFKKQTESIKGQKTLKQIMNKKKGLQSNHAVIDKENNVVEENTQDNEQHY